MPAPDIDRATGNSRSMLELDRTHPRMLGRITDVEARIIVVPGVENVMVVERVQTF